MDAVDQLKAEMDKLRGRLFEQVEACGFPDRQEEAWKRVIRHTTYDAQRDLLKALRGRANGKN